MKKFSLEKKQHMVHHEFAGLSGFEANLGGKSNYVISNKLVGFLEDQYVKKLALTPKKVHGSDRYKIESCGKAVHYLANDAALKPENVLKFCLNSNADAGQINACILAADHVADDAALKPEVFKFCLNSNADYDKIISCRGATLHAIDNVALRSEVFKSCLQ